MSSAPWKKSMPLWKQIVGRGREMIEPNEGDKRYARRDEQGGFTDERDDVGRPLGEDQRQQGTTESKPGRGDRSDRGDRKR